MNPSRLGMLIDSLASGADAFSSRGDGNNINEMEVVLGDNIERSKGALQWDATTPRLKLIPLRVVIYSLFLPR